ncbi:glycoside hydrolase family 2 TIM barrel-domain containing protein [Mucilaginibacter auburnensis]|uniref:Beta-galactosidase n=1 Tax=Mucilaginibacter auburnensis TaxID=1457233 RepID=A0A2H9VVJ7_9SPHI|nr:glycoside hydrolase family 2 TIM barrel-domain containing protein [Mucilaginibacter auburnensis]PJJ84837.1 beta-galactosidase [Mucilaginibacter auburnensis]
MRSIKTALLIACIQLSLSVNAQSVRRESPFDDNWKFKKEATDGAAMAGFDDKAWRTVDLPHDWSIEPLGNQSPGNIIGPFSKDSPGATATGYTMGGTAWYRKTFTFSPAEKYSQTIINFDGVYMNSEVWVNGKLLAKQPYGYTPFDVDISAALNPAGKPNVIAVKVANEGKNSRWYSGSGIYRHVTLIRKQTVHLPQNGVNITTENLNAAKATIKVAASVENSGKPSGPVLLSIKIIDPTGKVVQTVKSSAKPLTATFAQFEQNITVNAPKTWSVEKPDLYSAEIEVLANGKVTDKSKTVFGIRTIHFDAVTGFTLNGKRVLLKGGCLHHDNGFLGAATIDRAEERRVELMKKNGFNAIRTSHNPPSKQFLDACDKYGIVVIDEAFDMWERPKNPEDYHLYFKEWWKKDLKALIHRDRNHPSVVFWSIGNEINERVDSLGLAIEKELVAEVKRLDNTRPVTEAICSFWDHPGYKWESTISAFAMLDVGGYNYMYKEYEADHVKHPERIMMGTESYPKEAFENWQLVKKHPYVIGDFVWTAMDYFGETGLGNSRLNDETVKGILRPFPWFNGFCGDIDITGAKKPQMLYRDVLWENSNLEMLVHAPFPEGKREIVSQWGWPNEWSSWNWAGNEDKIMDVRVFSNYPLVRLELNGKVIGEQKLSEDTKLTATFKVPYQPGTLKAIGIKDGKELEIKQLTTTGKPAKIKLIADRAAINANRNDLSYVRIEITDANGNTVPNAEVPVRISVSGDGEIAGSGSASPNDMESVNNPVCKTYKGAALAILRPLKNGKKGAIQLKVEAEGLSAAQMSINLK